MVGAGTGRVTEGGELRHRDEALFPEEKISEEWPNYVCLSVTDTGCGMDKETMQHIFEPFYSTKKEKGNGLGMFITYGIVRRLGGEITVDSTEGKGTTVSITLPLTPPERPVEA